MLIPKNKLIGNIEKGKIYSLLHKDFGDKELIGTCVETTPDSIMLSHVYICMYVGNTDSAVYENSVKYSFSPILHGSLNTHIYTLSLEKVKVIGEVLNEDMLNEYKKLAN